MAAKRTVVYSDGTVITTAKPLPTAGQLDSKGRYERAKAMLRTPAKGAFYTRWHNSYFRSRTLKVRFYGNSAANRLLHAKLSKLADSIGKSASPLGGRDGFIYRFTLTPQEQHAKARRTHTRALALWSFGHISTGMLGRAERRLRNAAKAVR